MTTSPGPYYNSSYQPDDEPSYYDDSSSSSGHGTPMLEKMASGRQLQPYQAKTDLGLSGYRGRDENAPHGFEKHDLSDRWIHSNDGDRFLKGGFIYERNFWGRKVKRLVLTEKSIRILEKRNGVVRKYFSLYCIDSIDLLAAARNRFCIRLFSPRGKVKRLFWETADWKEAKDWVDAIRSSLERIKGRKEEAMSDSRLCASSADLERWGSGAQQPNMWKSCDTIHPPNSAPPVRRNPHALEPEENLSSDPFPRVEEWDMEVPGIDDEMMYKKRGKAWNRM